MLKLISLILFFPLTGLSQTGDTLLVQENQIVFFMVSQSEYDQEIKNDPDSGLDEVIGDFRYYANQFAKRTSDSLKVDFRLTSSPYLRVVTSHSDTLINRKTLAHIVGFVANDGERFLLKQGIWTDEEIASVLRQNLRFPEK